MQPWVEKNSKTDTRYMCVGEKRGLRGSQGGRGWVLGKGGRSQEREGLRLEQANGLGNSAR